MVVLKKQFKELIMPSHNYKWCSKKKRIKAQHQFSHDQNGTEDITDNTEEKEKEINVIRKQMIDRYE